MVGISGSSCSGKSTVAKAVRVLLGGDVTHLQQDLFFIDPDFCPADGNFCDPRYLHQADFENAVRSLAAGEPTVVPELDFTTFRRTGAVRVRPAAFLIVEGMTIFRSPVVYECCHHRFLLTPPFETLAARKRDRDVRERGKSPSIVEVQLSWMLMEYERDLHFGWAVTTIDSVDSAEVAHVILDTLRAG
ncbi:hypothetical protein AB0F68_06945 [Micromonospora sp. NPDC023966]|uniref:uridine kinase family protein n=1 Tax=Micromonospora sp. NPDC023966 TaxID=3154699 RepID=UPI00340B6623